MKAFAILGVLGGMLLISDAEAQLFSPGKLSRPHRDLEGMRNCTTCHELRTKGITNSKCLQCHTPLSKRITARKGFHADLADQNCATCHKEHFGLEFEVVRFDTTTFDHADMGFELVASHAEIGCHDCHKAALVQDSIVRSLKGEYGALNKTLLGLGTTCVACHDADDPHHRQFPSRGCEECHGEDGWEKAQRFDHDRTRYRLTGRHREIECGDCHRTVRPRGREPYVEYVGMPFQNCTSCHDDVHAGDLGSRCTDCHSTSGWHTIRRASAFERDFDHSTTEFSLVGQHAEADCSSCHGKPAPRTAQLHITFVRQTRQNTYPHPLADDCTSCHVDYHDNVFVETPGGVTCDNCHTEYGWLPGSYDIERHNREATFALTGTHVTTPCNLCHTKTGGDVELVEFRFGNHECVTCHEADDPHERQFADVACQDCHGTQAQSFKIMSYDHSKSRFTLDGEHRNVPCESCHAKEQSSDSTAFVRYKPLDMECNDCHGNRR